MPRLLVPLSLCISGVWATTVYETPSEYLESHCSQIIRWGNDPPRCVANARSDLPQFDPTCKHEIVFASHPVKAATGSYAASGKLGFLHTGITFKETCRKVNHCYTFEFWALDFTPNGLVVPEVRNGRPAWNNTAVVSWQAANPHRAWDDAEYMQEVLVGYADGSTLNSFMGWVLDWSSMHKYYQLWNVWNSPIVGGERGSSQKFIDDTTCSRFTQDALTALATSYDVVMNSREVICRSYVTLIAADVEDLRPDRITEVNDYFNDIQTLMKQVKKLTVDKALDVAESLLGSRIWESRSRFAYVYDRDNNIYHKAHLSSPYMSYEPVYLSQRMVLPWQRAEDANAQECYPFQGDEDRSILV